MTPQRPFRNLPLFTTQHPVRRTSNDGCKLFDANRDGAVTKFELKEALSSLGQNPGEEEMDVIFREYDTTQSGTLHFNEFKLLMAARLTYKVGLLFRG